MGRGVIKSWGRPGSILSDLSFRTEPLIPPGIRRVDLSCSGLRLNPFLRIVPSRWHPPRPGSLLLPKDSSRAMTDVLVYRVGYKGPVTLLQSQATLETISALEQSLGALLWVHASSNLPSAQPDLSHCTRGVGLRSMPRQLPACKSPAQIWSWKPSL